MKPEVVFQCIKDELENYYVSDIFDELGDENPVGEILNAISFMDKEHNQVLEISSKSHMIFWILSFCVNVFFTAVACSLISFIIK